MNTYLAVPKVKSSYTLSYMSYTQPDRKNFLSFFFLLHFVGKIKKIKIKQRDCDPAPTNDFYCRIIFNLDINEVMEWIFSLLFETRRLCSYRKVINSSEYICDLLIKTRRRCSWCCLPIFGWNLFSFIIERGQGSLV